MSEPARPLDPRLSREDLQLVQDLKRQSVDEVHRERDHERFALEIAVVLHPANASDVDRPRIRAVTRDLSEGGCGLLLDRAPSVGDIYRIEFEARPDVDLPSVIARCKRCSMVRDDAFEAGFAFFNQISLPGPDDAPAEDHDLFA